MKQLKKDITFIYMDSAEKNMYRPVAEEAKRRGYNVTLTDNKFAKCEIGFYCQHTNFPQYSRFSLIMLHDIIQQYSNWPDLWLREPWNKYDIGFLPSAQWVRNWNACSQYYYANPRIGVFETGWPKADPYAGIDKKTYKNCFNQKHGLDNSRRTILYAPSWENDHKQDDFVQAMLKLDVNILIKQAAVDCNQFPGMYHAIQEMHDLHKNLEHVTILPPETNIFDAILAADVLVSDESSTMCEAVMMGVPAVSVSDWLIPDVQPSRFPRSDYPFVFMTRKNQLTDFIRELLDDYRQTAEKVDGFRLEMFGESGGCASMIMDIVDDCAAGREIRYPMLAPAQKCRVPSGKLYYHLVEGAKRELYSNYCQRSKVLNTAYRILRNLKHILKRNG